MLLLLLLLWCLQVAAIQCHGLYSAQQLGILKNALSAAIASSERILIGKNS